MNNDIRNLSKWLNEEQETPIDRQALARVLAMAEQPAQQQPVGPSGHKLSDFQEGQWWLRELDAAVAGGTCDQKRAVAVVRNMLATAQAHLAEQPAQQPFGHTSAANAALRDAQNRSYQIAKAAQQGCMRCNTPKKCALYGCSPLTWPAEQPAQRKPLTDEEIILIVADCASSHQHTDIHFARAIERAHGIKELV